MSEKDPFVSFSVRIPKSEKDAFLAYLEKNSVGVTTSEKFRQFIYKVNTGELVLKHSAMKELKKTALQKSKIPIDQSGWYYHKELQCLIKKGAKLLQ